MLTNIQLLDFLLAILVQGYIKKKIYSRKYSKNIQEMVHFCERLLKSHASV